MFNFCLLIRSEFPTEFEQDSLLDGKKNHNVKPLYTIGYIISSHPDSHLDLNSILFRKNIELFRNEFTRLHKNNNY